MSRINNIDLGRVSATIELMRRDPASAKRVTRVEGLWIFDDPDIQFRAELKSEKGATTVEMSLPSFMGGSGHKPGPMHYCLFGLASCFLSTVAAVAAERGVELRKARIEAECQLDFSKTFGVAERPIVEEVVFKVELASNAERAKLQGILDEAMERCPAVYSLKNPIKVRLELT